jgi:hypothetical protein
VLVLASPAILVRARPPTRPPGVVAVVGEEAYPLEETGASTAVRVEAVVLL